MITEAEEAARDREAADLVYRQARVTAMVEFDALEPQLAKMQSRIASLRRVIWGVSGLLGDHVDEKYMFPLPKAQWGGANNRQANDRFNRGGNERGSIGPPRK